MLVAPRVMLTGNIFLLLFGYQRYKKNKNNVNLHPYISAISKPIVHEILIQLILDGFQRQYVISGNSEQLSR